MGALVVRWEILVGGEVLGLGWMGWEVGDKQNMIETWFKNWHIQKTFYKLWNMGARHLFGQGHLLRRIG